MFPAPAEKNTQLDCLYFKCDNFGKDFSFSGRASSNSSKTSYLVSQWALIPAAHATIWFLISPHLKNHAGQSEKHFSLSSLNPHPGHVGIYLTFDLCLLFVFAIGCALL